MGSPADDRFAITDLLFEYASLIDSGDLEGLASLFEHATYRTEGTSHVLTGADEVLAAQRHVLRLYDGSPRTHHNISNVCVSVDVASATAASYFTVLFAPPGAGPSPILTGRYHDTFEQVDGAWRFTDRLIHLDQVGDLSEHLHLDRLTLDRPSA